MVDYGQISQHNYGDMQKIFTIGFSGKSPDAFMDVLNAMRVRTVHCHRHLAAEYIASQIPDIDIVHL